MSEQQYTKLVSWKYGSFLGLIHDPDQFGLIEKFGEYCESEVDIFREFVKEDSIVIDCGASMGAHTVALAKLCPKGRVYAFEPQRIPFQVLCGNVQLNSCENVHAIPFAVGDYALNWDDVGQMKTLSPFEEQKWGMNRIEQLDFAEGCDRVKIVCLDRADDMNPYWSFIKIDVEGFEPAVLKGAYDGIMLHKPVIYVEFNWNQEEIAQILKSCGYTLWTHGAPAARQPNFNGVAVPDWPPTPMLLAIPSDRDQSYPERSGFTRV